MSNHISRELLGRRITAARALAHGMSRETLGRRVDFSAEQIGRYERGESAMKRGTVELIAKATGVPLGFFLSEWGAPVPSERGLEFTEAFQEGPLPKPSPPAEDEDATH